MVYSLLFYTHMEMEREVKNTEIIRSKKRDR